MSDKKVTVWYDDTSIEHGYVVDVWHEDGGCDTVKVFDTQEEAIAYGREFASNSNMLFEDLTA